MVLAKLIVGQAAASILLSVHLEQEEDLEVVTRVLHWVLLYLHYCELRHHQLHHLRVL